MQFQPNPSDGNHEAKVDVAIDGDCELEDGEYIEEEQEMTLNEFYAATQEILNQAGISNQSFDCSDLTRLISMAIKKKGFSNMLDISKTGLTQEQT